MADFFEALFKFFTEFTWRKLLAVIVVMCVVFGAFSLYERYTSSFRLSRLQKAADLLIRLQEIQSHGANSSPEFEKARQAVMAQAVQAIEEKPMTLDFVPSKLTFSIDSLWKFVAGSSLWLVFILFQLSKLKTKEGRNELSGMLLLAGVSGVVALFVPPIWWPWFHILIYPWLLIAAVISAIVPVALVVSLRSAKNKAQMNACINNLRQIDGAIHQWALENMKKDDAAPTEKEIAMYLTNRSLPKCPAGGTYTLHTVAQAPTCSVQRHKLPN